MLVASRLLFAGCFLFGAASLKLWNIRQQVPDATPSVSPQADPYE